VSPEEACAVVSEAVLSIDLNPPMDIAEDVQIGLRWVSGRVTYVRDGGWGHQHGIIKDMVMQTVDGQIYSQNLLRQKLEGQANFTVTFSAPRMRIYHASKVHTVTVHKQTGDGLQISCFTLDGTEVASFDLLKDANIDALRTVLQKRLVYNVEIRSLDGGCMEGSLHAKNFDQLTAKRLTDTSECPSCKFESQHPREDHMNICTCGLNSMRCAASTYDLILNTS
jgi:hypothetical protein